MSQRNSQSNPEFELHHRHLLLRRQAARRYGIILIVSGVLYFLFVAVCLMPLLFLHSRRLAGEVAGLCGATICLYFVLSGAASIHEGWRPITSREVRRKRRETRQQLFQLAQGELPSDYTRKGRIIALITGSIVTITGALTLLFLLIGIPGLAWARVLLGIIALLVELALILDVFYIRAKAAKDLPDQSVQELSLLLASGELTAGEIASEEE